MSEKNRFTLLIVDDEKNTREGLRRALARKYRVLLAEGGNAALDVLAHEHVDLMLSDVRMPDMDGLTLLKRVKAQYPGVVAVMLTAYGSVETAVEAIKLGADNFLIKPVNLDHLEMLLERALRAHHIEAENRNLREQLDNKYGMENILGSSPAMEAVFDIIRQAAPTHATVLIQGPSGTGKELVAHAIHRLSTRASGPFVPVHCAALSATLLESELFGHERGAFTGATGQRKGRFELADGGTLFLDEISEIDATVQVKLLRVLEERTFERVGGDETHEVDIRLIAATNRDLRQMVEEGKFREDLFFRLDVVDIRMPPLRERDTDIAILATHFLNEFAERNGKVINGITPDAVALLHAYGWPGNVRELRNTMEKMVVLARGDRLTARDVPHNIREDARAAMGGGFMNGGNGGGFANGENGGGRGFASGVGGGVRTLPQMRRGAHPDDGFSAGLEPTGNLLAETERQKIMSVLQQCNGNRTRAAEILGISRRTLHRKLSDWGIRGPRSNKRKEPSAENDVESGGVRENGEPESDTRESGMREGGARSAE